MTEENNARAVASDTSDGSDLSDATPEPGKTADPARVIEALLFAADEPLSAVRLAELTRIEQDAIRTAVDVLNASYHETGRTFRVHKVAQGYQLYTTAEYADWVRTLYQHQSLHRLSRAALEVLAIIAYNQPVTRPEIEKLRGVDCSGPLLTLLERRLIATAGRARRAGNPFLYRTTREFLRYFGLESLDDLPRKEDLGEFLAGHEPGAQGQSERRVETETFDSLAVDMGSRTPEAARAAPDARESVPGGDGQPGLDATETPRGPDEQGP
jgi:segregation and condensation protein B